MMEKRRLMNFSGRFLAFFLLVQVLILGPGAGTVLASCVTAACHQDMARIARPHAPVAEGECLECHRRQAADHPRKGGGRSFVLVATGAALCANCHDLLPAGKVVHEPVAEGDCLSCHQAHGGTGEFLLAVKDDQASLCLECHEGDDFSREYVHGPVGSGACTQCHDPHAADQPALLRQPSRRLCLSCHQELEPAPGAVLHQPFTAKKCTACHAPHSAAQSRLLREEYPGLCFSCHQQVGREYKKAKEKHLALYKDERCGNCHAVHFSPQPGLLLEKEMDLCLGCHGKDDTRKSKPLKNIKTELEGKKHLHGPLAEGSCSACHRPHGSDYFRLLSGSYPASFYAPYHQGTYDFCLSCHELNLLRFPDTTIYTAFRNGKQNLHYLHVVNRRKGRSCRACHQPHAGSGVKLINEEGAPFGDWKIPLRLVLTPTGGSCAPGCHSCKSYDRKNPLDYNHDRKK